MEIASEVLGSVQASDFRPSCTC